MNESSNHLNAGGLGELTGDGFDLGKFDGYDPFAKPMETMQADFDPFGPQNRTPRTDNSDTGPVENGEEENAEYGGNEETPDGIGEPDDDEENNIGSIPQAAPKAAEEVKPKKDTPGQKPEAAANEPEGPANPLQVAMAQAEEKEAKKNAASLFGKPPIFSHGNVNEEINDKKMTFDQLRIEKARDFSELEDSSKVSWTVEYGKTTKIISNPKKDVIHTIKQEIETSKAFLETLKKDGAKDLVCKVKPKITVQKKGIASYKGIFGSIEEAMESEKPICILPARDGNVYELRRNEVGTFIAPVSNVVDLSEVRAGFTPALPPVPFDMFCEIIAFFRSFIHEETELEALVHIYWDKTAGEYRVAVPTQWVQKAAVDAVISLEDVLDDERFIHFADIHSHNTMAAKFSPTDDMDEKASRVYIVVGELDSYFPSVRARASCNGVFIDVDIADIIAPLPEGFPSHWASSVKTCPQPKTGIVDILRRIQL